MSRPGETVEGITVPEGDPDALRTASRQLDGVVAQLEGSSGQLSGLPSLMSGWAGPASAVFAQTSGQEAASVRSAAASVALAALQVNMNADGLQDAQHKAQRAIRRAERARDEIDQAREDIRDAEQAQADAKQRMELAQLAREAAEQQMLASVVDSVAGGGAAAAAAQVADAQYHEAERDLQAAIEREGRARRRLAAAQEDLRDARELGREAAQDAENAALVMQSVLLALPSGTPAMTGAPAYAHVAAAAGIPRSQAPKTNEDVPLGEREPPEGWPGWMKAWFKVGRGTATAIDGTADLAKSAVENPGDIPGATWGFGERAVDDPLGTGKALVGYDLLASGRIEDWLGQAGFAAVTGAAGAAPARAQRLNRVVGSPRIRPLGRLDSPMNAKLAGRRMDFSRPNLGAPPGSRQTTLPDHKREALAERYPAGVRFTRAGYPVFTPYAIERLPDDGMSGDYDHDAGLANDAAGLPDTPDGYVWHHVEDGRTMELVPQDLHRNARHTGGAADIEGAREAGIAPGGVPTPGEQRLGRVGVGGGVLLGGARAAEGTQP